MIEVSGLKMSFGEKTVLAIDRILFEEGKVHGIIGLNGAGKTTFFNLLAAFFRQNAGTITRDQQPIMAKDTGFLETGNYFYSGLTGAEYLKIFPATNTRFNLDAINELMQLPLNEVVESYSTGMKKKLAILAIIRQDKPVYIFDEPFNGLDLETNRSVEIIIETLKAKGKTIFISSHILSPLLATCDKIHLLQAGNFKNTYSKADFSQIEHDLFASFNEHAAGILNSSL